VLGDATRRDRRAPNAPAASAYFEAGGRPKVRMGDDEVRVGDDELRIAAPAGTFEGCAMDGHVAFYAIPYAQPPVGSLRYAPPVPLEPLSGVQSAQQPGPAPPQPPVSTLSAVPGQDVQPLDESCLHLNVYVPSQASRTSDAPLPVMVWIFGGGFFLGCNHQPLYDPRALVERGQVIVVILNYRLGPLASLDLASLGIEEQAGLNLHLQDQLCALGWVQRNIAAFGGAADNVTVFGESAGGTAVASLLGTAGIGSLVKRAIVQSCSSNHLVTEVQRADLAQRLGKRIKLAPGDLAGLRKINPKRLSWAAFAVMLQSYETIRIPWAPTVDGSVLPTHPLEALRAGNAAGVELMIGCNRDEWRLWERFKVWNRWLGDGALSKLLARKLGDAELAARVIPVYREARAGVLPDRNYDLLCAVETDRVYRNSALSLAEAALGHAASVRMYRFDWQSPDASLGCCHAMELPFVFGTVDVKGGKKFLGAGPEVQQLSHRMIDAWTGFARDGNPGHEGIGDWPVYDVQRRATMLLGEACGVVDDPMSAERMVWG